jgi:hypothetical protein
LATELVDVDNFDWAVRVQFANFVNYFAGRRSVMEDEVDSGCILEDFEKHGEEIWVGENADASWFIEGVC